VQANVESYKQKDTTVVVTRTGIRLAPQGFARRNGEYGNFAFGEYTLALQGFRFRNMLRNGIR